MKDVNDYSKTIFSQGIVCRNKNNGTCCVIIDGKRGTEDDRCSLVMEFMGEDGFTLHTPPNRALVPTGRICHNLKFLRHLLIQNVADTERREEDDI